MNLREQRTHFTPDQVRDLMAKRHIFYEEDPELPNYPFVVFIEKPVAQWAISDAWHISVEGEVNPDEFSPVPVRYSDVVAVDFASPDDLQHLAKYIKSEPMVMVFGLPDISLGVISIGVGWTERGCRQDAATRLHKRFPKIHKSSEPHQLLLALTHQGVTKKVAEIRNTKYPTQEEMGHDYASNETYQLAMAAASDAGLCSAVEALPKITAESVRALCKKHLQVSPQLLNSAFIDWYEMADSLTPEKQHQVEAPNPQRAAPANPAASPELPQVDGRRIDADVLDVLKRATADGKQIRLPNERLERKLYERVNEVLTALGGRWKGGKTQAHCFEEDAAPILEVALATGSFVKPQDFGYFPTPPELVQRVLGMVYIKPGMRLLEPQGGTGAFAVPMAQLAGVHNVTTYELLPQNAQKLREAGLENVHQADFLTVAPEPVYDLVIMNPPFERGVDIEHVMHATRFLKPDGELVAITSRSWAHNSNKKFQSFREFTDQVQAQVEQVEAGAFRTSGTNVATSIVHIEACNLPWYNTEAAEECGRPRERATC
jgi:protein-L-isoaspartate O-methyltransferase